jgi:hypothetical protein
MSIDGIAPMPLIAALKSCAKRSNQNQNTYRPQSENGSDRSQASAHAVQRKGASVSPRQASAAN